MSGHNKWSKIKNKKAVEDVKKSKIFSILSKNISLEVKKAGGDKNSPNVKTAVDKAKTANMPMVNIEKALNKQDKKGENLEEVLYEGYGPGGVGIIMKGITDNRNRTAAEIKNILSKNGGNLGGPGSALWMFEKDNDDWRAKQFVDVDENIKEKILKIFDELEENEDIEKTIVNIKL